MTLGINKCWIFSEWDNIHTSMKSIIYKLRNLTLVDQLVDFSCTRNLLINTWWRKVFLICSNIILWHKNDWFNIVTFSEFVTSSFSLQNIYNSFALLIFWCIFLYSTTQANRFTFAMTFFKVDTYASHVSWCKPMYCLIAFKLDRILIKFNIQVNICISFIEVLCIMPIQSSTNETCFMSSLVNDLHIKHRQFFSRQQLGKLLLVLVPSV